MVVAWTDFLLIAAVVKELVDAIRYFKSRGKKHVVVRTAAEKYRKLFKNPAFAKLMEDGRTRLKVYKQLRKDFLNTVFVKITTKFKALTNFTIMLNFE